MSCQCNQCKVKELEAKNAELENRINVLEFHLQEIADSDLVASNLKAMARNAIKKQALSAIKDA